MIFRCARHTDDLEKIEHFYCTVMGMEVIGRFTDHDGYSGVMLGKNGASWHLEFTQCASPAVHNFDEDDILVFYPANEDEYNSIIAQADQHSIERAAPKNPYWQRNGVMLLDPDGYRIVVSSLRSK